MVKNEKWQPTSNTISRIQNEMQKHKQQHEAAEAAMRKSKQGNKNESVSENNRPEHAYTVTKECLIVY